MILVPALRLIRLEEDHNEGTFGTLIINSKIFCVTLEPRDEFNLPNISSIPAQQYECQRNCSQRHGETFRIMNVPSRTDILFHPGNFVNQTEGCIILAQYFGKLRGNRAVLNSGQTFRKFMQLLKNFDTCHLTIKEAY